MNQEREFLRNLLSQIVEEQVGPHVYDMIKPLMKICEGLEKKFDTKKAKKLFNCLEKLDKKIFFPLIHSHSIYFQLIDIAENVDY